MSPPLAWDGVPDGTKSLALILDDPDAPDPKAPKRVWVHWILYNIPPNAGGLAENADKTGLPPGTARGTHQGPARRPRSHQRGGGVRPPVYPYRGPGFHCRNGLPSAREPQDG